MSKGYIAFQNVLRPLGWDDAGRGCWGRKYLVAPGPDQEYSRRADASAATVVARWVDADTTRAQFRQLLDETEQLARACRAAIQALDTTPRQTELFPTLTLEGKR